MWPLLLASLVQVVGPPSKSNSSDDIVVEAPRRHEIEEFVGSVSNLGRSRQLARFEDEACPSIFGLETNEAAFVKRRIADLARLVHLQRSYPGCLPTTLILFTGERSDEIGNEVREFLRKYPNTIGHEGTRAWEAFASSTSGVRWINLTDIEGGDIGSLLTKGRSRAIIQNEIIIVDGHQLGGVTLSQITDFLAMVVLANPRPGADAPAWSILSLFQHAPGVTPPPGATSYDLAFLKGVYKARPYSSGKQQESDVTDSMTQSH